MMQCLECGAEMQLTERTISDDTIPAPGYEHQTFECSRCRQLERRRVFRGPLPSSSTVAAAAVASTTGAGGSPAVLSAPCVIEEATGAIALTPIPSGTAEALNEDQELLRRAIAMVRGPIGASQTIRGITDGLKSPAAMPAAMTRARKSGRVVEICYDPEYDAAFAAKDVRTGMVVLRHRDSLRLQQMCDRLGWQLAENDVAASKE